MEKMEPHEPIEWKEEYNVDVSFIDEHHRHFLEILNRFRDAGEEGLCKERMSQIFFSLVHYAEHYLMREIIYFKEYPNFSTHQAAHNNFIDRIEKFQNDYRIDQEGVCKEMYEYLYDWFRNHILKYDKEAVEYLKSKGLT